MERYERASTQTYTSLAVLNSGQAVIFTIGMTVVMVARRPRHHGAADASIGSFVLVNAMLVQLYIPLNFMGMLYREIKQALIDIDDMFKILEPQSGDRGQARRASRSSSTKGACASRTCTSPTCRSGRS